MEPRVRPSLSAEEVLSLLGLKPLQEEGGFFRETYRSSDSTCIYYLITPQSFSSLHRIRFDEIFHFYAGSPVEMAQLARNGTLTMHRLGTDLGAGERPQVIVAGGVWQGLRLVEGGAWALLGTTVAPPFEFKEYEAGNREELLLMFPGYRAVIERFLA